MKKWLLLMALSVEMVLVVPQGATAQWTDPFHNYRMNDLIRRMPQKKTARKTTVKRQTISRTKIAKKPVPVKKRT